MSQEDMKYKQFKRHFMDKKSKTICILFIVIVMMLLVNKELYPVLNEGVKEMSALQELEYYVQTQTDQCSNIKEEKPKIHMKDPSSLDKYFKRPNCNNLLANMINGKWVSKTPKDWRVVNELNEIHTKYRFKTGIPVKPWRSDKHCGYNVLAPKVSNKWPQTSSFCDPQGLTPCCTDNLNGICVAVTDEQQCDCPTCVDTRIYQDALTTNWITKDESCKWNNYTTEEACAVMNKLSKNHATAHIHFVGDSLMRNMFMGFSTILAKDLRRGIHKTCLSRELKSMCWGENLFVLRACHDIAAAHNLNDLHEKHGPLCDGQRNFEAKYIGIGMPGQQSQLIELLNKLQGKENTYIILGVGLHFQCKSKDVISEYLQPMITLLKYTKNTWPQLVWVHPNSVGLLKPPAYMSTQGDAAINKFANEIETYLRPYGIPALDFRQITKGVHSYDGTHFGAGVNIMKAQILLNYFATTV